MADLDLICLGRSSVDLYGEQVGGRLEDMASFAKYVGGCPANIAVGAARLGLKSALITRVGDEHMGRFIREELEREGVDVSHVKTDPDRLTALVVLGIRDRDTFPLIFYRTECADMAIEAADVEPGFIASARALLISGTHLSTSKVRGASMAAAEYARAAGTRVVLDIDYRPVLWGLTGLGQGEERFIADGSVTGILRDVVPSADLIVGTEEEIHIAGGGTDTQEALRRLRGLTDAVLVLKLGPMGSVAFPGPIPQALEDGVSGTGFPVEVFNVLGAGDAFMSGFLRGWLRDESLETCSTYANACGAFAVSRHGCAPAIPTWPELEHFLANGSPHHRLREDSELNHIHWATTRAGRETDVLALAFDHGEFFEDLARAWAKEADDISRFKALVWRAAQIALPGAGDLGVVVDDRHGMGVLFSAAGAGAWIARPLGADGPEAGLVALLRDWPVGHVVKYTVPRPSGGGLPLAALHAACRATHHELLLEAQGDEAAEIVEAVYGAGARPDWWMVRPPPDRAGWDALSGVIQASDPYCRGVLAGGLDGADIEAVRLARGQKLCKGFAAGRSVFAAPALAWFSGAMTDGQAVDAMAGAFGRLVALWRERE